MSFYDSDFHPPPFSSIQVLWFDAEDVHVHLRGLPATQAVAPPSLLAILWKALAQEFAGPTFEALAHC